MPKILCRFYLGLQLHFGYHPIYLFHLFQFMHSNLYVSGIERPFTETLKIFEPTLLEQVFPQKTAFRALKLEHHYKSYFVQMFILKCLLWTSVVQSQDLKLSGWVSCSEWSCEKPIQEGIARLNFIGVKECSKIWDHKIQQLACDGDFKTYE